MRYVLRTAHILVDTVVLFIILAVVFFASYNIWDNYQIYNAASSNQFQEYQPQAYDPDAKKSIDERFHQLQKINPDVFGWIHLFGTQINYPMVQGKDNQKYLNLDPFLRFSLSGSIFLDANTPKDFSNFSSVVYGHHMEKHKMFGDLDNYREASYAKKHAKGNLYYQGVYHGFDVVTFIDTDAYDAHIYGHWEEPDRKEALVSYIKQVGLYQLTDISSQDHLVMLSTCADGTDKRYIVVVKILDKAYPEPKREVYEENTPMQIVKHYWWVTFAIVPLIIITLIYLLYSRKQKGVANKEHEDSL